MVSILLGASAEVTPLSNCYISNSVEGRDTMASTHVTGTRMEHLEYNRTAFSNHLCACFFLVCFFYFFGYLILLFISIVIFFLVLNINKCDL